MVQEMISTIVGAITGMLTGVGSGIVDFFNTTVLTSEGKLTTFAAWLLAFLGIGFALGVVKFVTNLVRSGTVNSFSQKRLCKNEVLRREVRRGAAKPRLFTL